MTDASSSAAGAKRKRKRTDPNLEIITLDPHYDLVLVVGTPEHPDGQKAFQVNKGSMRHVSDIWSKMLTGEWAESKMTEIDFPEDSWKPFEIVLKIAHVQAAELPRFLSIKDLQALATLTDKYNLVKAVSVGLKLYQWLHTYRKQWMSWPSETNIQHFAFMTSVFRYDRDVAFVTSKLAVKAQVDNGLYICHGSGTSRTKLGPSLPDRLLDNINKLRDELLSGLIKCCKLAIATAAKADRTTSCGMGKCALLKTGILITDLTAAGLFPVPADAKDLHSNFLSYWRAVKRIGAKWTGVGCGGYNSCFEDFGIKNEVKAMLKRAVHEDVYEHLQTDAFMRSTY